MIEYDPSPEEIRSLCEILRSKRVIPDLRSEARVVRWVPEPLVRRNHRQNKQVEMEKEE